MDKLKSIEKFKTLRERIISNRDLNIPTIIIPAGTCGQASGTNDIIRITKRELLEKELTGKINLRITGCHGFCEMEPSILIEPFNTFYPKIDSHKIPKIIQAVKNGQILEDFLFADPNSNKRVEKLNDVVFFKSQTRTILSRNEKVDPIRIFNYLANDGYSSLIKVLEKGDRKWLVNQIKISGLRGRGGAGFYTGVKWEMLASQPGNNGKFLICNADEGDPGAYMDRSILEGNPHSILEGMTIGAYGTGATEGIIYVRNEYPLAIKHLIIAIRQAREIGLLGKSILGTRFSFDIKLVRGAGAFVCGEETALIKSLEGKIGEPRQRPPFPIEKGFNNKPTAINNVETWANIPVIISKGAREFTNIGTKGNSGTKIFSLVGKVRNTGLVEVPMGTTIDKIIYDIGGGSAGSLKIKAVQTGGPSGGCIPAGMFNLPIDYESLAKAGSIMGSGGMIVMDESTCMVDIAKYYMNFLKDESCGKCFTCRKGTQRMYEILDDISRGRGTLSHLDLLEELAAAVKDTTMCGLGQTASNPVLTTLKYFRNEYLEHIKYKKCPAGVCKELTGAPCQSACPVGTEAWRYVAHIQRREYKKAYNAIREPNPLPSICARVCHHPCERKCRLGTSGDQPVSIRALKRFVVDKFDPLSYKPKKKTAAGAAAAKVAVVGSGPAGLSAAHYLSLNGYKVTVFEKEDKPGGMLICGIPEYRLPRDVLQREIEALLDKDINIKFNTTLGKDIKISQLLDDGFKAVFLAMGAHRSLGLKLKNEDAKGVLTSMEFLKSFNLKNKNLAKGRVGVIGGGNSAIDAARVAVRQKGVKSVTVLYRRTRQEMPAFDEEIKSAVDEGIEIVTLVTPVKLIVRNNFITGLEMIRNKSGDIDSSGRRRPVPVKGSEYPIPLETLIVAVGEIPDIASNTVNEIEITKWGTIQTDKETLTTSNSRVFAGGDAVTGPNTVIDAIAAGKKAAAKIDRFLRSEELNEAAEVRLPDVYVEPLRREITETGQIKRFIPPQIPVKSRNNNFNEVEMPFTIKDAIQESNRCLRCDLEFTSNKKE
ncbi:MAG: FAD-dependent oxidoreductase [bacterium]